MYGVGESLFFRSARGTTECFAQSILHYVLYSKLVYVLVVIICLRFPLHEIR